MSLEISNRYRSIESILSTSHRSFSHPVESFNGEVINVHIVIVHQIRKRFDFLSCSPEKWPIPALEKRNRQINRAIAIEF